MIMCGGDKKRERKVPDRYRDAAHWKLFAEEQMREDGMATDALQLPPASDMAQLPLASPTRVTLEAAAGVESPVAAPSDGKTPVSGDPTCRTAVPTEGARCGSPPHPVELERGEFIPVGSMTSIVN